MLQLSSFLYKKKALLLTYNSIKCFVYFTKSFVRFFLLEGVLFKFI